jgi:hypothetical protein
VAGAAATAAAGASGTCCAVPRRAPEAAPEPAARGRHWRARATRRRRATRSPRAR